jgi:hypothetical protein
MSDPWEAEVFRVPDLSWQTQPPPARHPIPVRYVPELKVGDEVTIGVPTQYFIDGQVVALAERQRLRTPDADGEQELLAVAAPFAYWLAQGYPRAGLTMQWWPVEHSWTYQDAAARSAPDDAPPTREGHSKGHRESHREVHREGHRESWLDHVQPTLVEPPVRRPVPARAAGSLTGRTVRLQHERGAWSWWVAVSEPVDAQGDIVVHAMLPTDYWLAQAASEPVPKARAIPLHRLYTYE